MYKPAKHTACQLDQVLVGGDLLALKNAQQHTWTKVGYLGIILTIDQS